MSRIHIFIVSTIIIMLLSTPMPASAQDPGCAVYSNTLCVTNGIFDVFVQSSGSWIGTYTIRTGANHPATLSMGEPQSVLYLGYRGDPGAGYSTIRSYTSHTDYVTGSGHYSDRPDWLVVNLDVYSTGTTYIGNNGIETTWILPGLPATPDKLKIVQKIEIFGNTFTYSNILIKISVTNLDANPVDLGVRYFWDLQIGYDDGPTFSQANPDGPVLTRETQFQLPEFESYVIQDNDVNPNPPTFNVHGTVTGP